MAAPNLVPLIVVSFSLKSLLDGVTSKTVQISNIPLVDSSEILPILKALPSVGTVLDTYLPQATTATIRVNNEPGSYGFQRRFCDILERYTLVDQSVTVYLKFIAPTTTSYTVSSSDQIWKAKAASYSTQFQGASEVSIDLVADTISRDVLTYTVQSSIVSGAETSSIGKSLPFVIGQGVDVYPVMISSSTTQTKYLYATTYTGNKFPVDGIADVYVEYDGAYYAIDGAASTSTKLFDSSTGTIVTTVTGNDESSRTRSLATSGLNYILAQAEVIFTQGTAGASGTLTLEIWANDANGIPKTLVGSSSRDKADYTWGAGNVTVDFAFDRPIPLVDPNEYSAYITQGNTNSTSSIPPAYDNALTQETSYYNSTATGAAWTVHYFDQYPFASRFYGFTLTDDPEGFVYEDEVSGLAAANFTFAQQAAISGSIANPDLSSLRLIANIGGLCDDSSGTLTGTPGLLLNAPKNIMALLDREWNGSTWAAGKFDFTKFSSTHTNNIDGGSSSYNRGVNGRIDGPATRDFIMSEICRASASRVTLYNGGTKQLALYAWGANNASTRTIDEEDCRITRYDVRGSDSIVNFITIRYAQNLRYYKPLDGLTSRQSPDLFGVLQLYDGYSTLGTELLSVSNDLYGKRENANPDYPLLSESASVSVMLKYLAARYGAADAYVTLELLDLNKYSTVDMLDIITVTSPLMPSFFGTAADAYYPTYSVTGVDLVAGEYWRRAQPTRLQVEGREVFFSENSPPGLRLLCRVLNNYPKDPT